MEKKQGSILEKLSWKTRFSYGCGDTACNVVFGMISTVLTLFYTDYVGVSAATVGMVMLLSRVFDGFSDVIMGFIVERTNSKWGKSRPWILWMAAPYAVSAVLLFTVPHTTNFLQFLYMFVTYNFCTTICYTAINLPYGSLSTMMSRSSEERSMLSIVRMGMSPFGRILAVTCTMPFVKLFGDTQSSWVIVMGIWAVIAMVLLVICFANCQETVKIEAREKQEKIPALKALKLLVTNQYFCIGPLDDAECDLRCDGTHPAVLLQVHIPQRHMDVQYTVSDGDADHRSIHVYRMPYPAETLREEEYGACRSGVSAGRTACVLCKSLQFSMDAFVLYHQGYRIIAVKCHCLWHAGGCGGIRTVEASYPPGEPDICRRVGGNKDRFRPGLSHHDGTSLTGRLSELCGRSSHPAPVGH